MAIVPSPNDLSLRQLQYIVAVADALGFHKAAARCGVSQPTLSAQVQQLESVLGVKLFERDKKRVLVTLAGKEIIVQARRILTEVDDLIASATRGRDPLSGRLRVGVIPTLAPYLLPEITPQVTARYPKLRLVFLEEKTDAILKDLHDGRLDVGLVALEAELGDVASAEVAKDPFVVALPKDHPLTKKKRLSMEDLEDVDVLLLDEGHCFRTQALELCSKAGAHEADFRATSLPTLAQMVASGAGLTLLPTMAVPVENRGGQLEIRPLTKPAPSRTVVLVWRPQSPFGEAFRELARAMGEACG